MLSWDCVPGLLIPQNNSKSNTDLRYITPIAPVSSVRGHLYDHPSTYLFIQETLNNGHWVSGSELGSETPGSQKRDSPR